MSKYDGDVYYVGSWSKALLESAKKNKFLRPFCLWLVTTDIVVRKGLHRFVASGQLARTLVFVPLAALALFVMFLLTPSGELGQSEDSFMASSDTTNAMDINSDPGWFEDDASFFHITSEKGLLEFASRVNRGDVSLSCVLDNDLDMTGLEFIQAADTTKNPSLSFLGTFDGNGRTITGLSFSGNSTGLFGRIGKGGCIKSLTIIAAAKGNELLSCIAARNSGTISDCSVVADLEGPSDSLFIGGIAAYSDGTVSGCTATGKLTGGAYIGGIVGTNNGTVSGCSFDGTVSGELSCGGIAGHNETGTITDCSDGKDSVITASTAAGGICGNNSESASITDCLCRGTQNSEAGSGRICGISYGEVTSCFYAEGDSENIFKTNEMVGINYGVIEGQDDTSD